MVPAASYPPLPKTQGRGTHQVFYGTNTPLTLTGSTCPSTVGNIMHRVYAFNFGSSDNVNVMSIANCRDTTRTQSFTYDVLNRIASAQSSGPQWGETFTIDPWGNLTNEAGIAGKTNHEGLNTSAGPSNQLSSFGYDPPGNMTSNGGTTYIYDAENRLIWTTGGYRYLYDGDGNRVEKCVAGSAGTPCPTSGTNGTLYWMGTGTAALNESDLSGNILEQYVFFGGQRVARRDVATNTVHYYFSDHLGTHTVVENATGTACEQDIDYYPYGGQENDYCPNVAQHYKFNGKERDSESGLDNFGKRYFGSSLGRFMTPDPLHVMKQKLIDPQQWNMYAYVRNNPLRFIDPTGLYVCQGNTDQCKAIQTALQNVQKAADTLAKGTDAQKKEAAALQKVLGFYGDEGKKNGVVVKFGDLKGKAEANTGTSSIFGLHKTTTVTFDLNQVHHDFSVGGRDEAGETAALTAHEGQHGVDQREGLPQRGLANTTAEENRAFTTGQGYVSEGLGFKSAYGIWDPGWPSDEAQENRESAIGYNAEKAAEQECKDGGC
jgi:RHS repeat-associated protein